MNEQNHELQVHAASVSDRGLSEKRPLNEDSFLADAKRRIFAVADGVGGAQAGEVASQTAMEVLDEAFRHQTLGADIEDLMEIAIQRANASIHRMSHEHPKLSMMATTIVALHLDGKIATIGHVGDSRLYRLTPDGQLHRETQDHSVVEEEVRAGRMTPDQAAHHPSRNVISRALGAEETVEVDLKTIEVQSGTSFLLCSDGITRHISDAEIRELLSQPVPLADVCAELKRRCFERGAEDNLTAVIVSVGPVGAERNGSSFDEERTISLPRPLVGAPPPAASANADPPPVVANSPEPAPGPPLPPPPADPVGAPTSTPPPAPVRAPPRRSALAAVAWLFLSLVLIAAAGAAGFLYGKQKGESDSENRLRAAQAAATPSPTPVPVDAATLFDQRRRNVDSNPQAMIRQLSENGVGKPLDSSDPETLYLYGRALLLTGKPIEASEALKKASDNLQDRSPRDPVKVDAKLSAAVAALKTGNWQAAQTASKQVDEVIQRDNPDSGAVPSATLAP
jgi:serine/threonine protein phosphatase PrpC